MLTHLSLFSGIGGLDLAADWAGFKTVGQCEFADYPKKVLEKHWPDVPRWRDIRTLTRESFYEHTGLHTVDIISGGFPCQPFSVAGKRRGKDDDRYLWPEMLRVIKELRPRWVVGENVAGIVNLALDQVLFDLEAKGYETRAVIIPACAVNAPHQRYRVAIMGHANSAGREKQYITTIPINEGFSGRGFNSRENVRGYSEDVADANGIRHDRQGAGESDHDQEQNNQASKQGGRTEFHEAVSSSADVCHATSKGFQDGPGKQMGRREQEQEFKRPNCNGTEWWAVEPDVGRVAHGISARVDRLKCLGNAVVPQQFYPIFKAIADIDGGR